LALSIHNKYITGKPLKRVFHCDIGEESAYIGKLQELLTGTPQWSSSLCAKQRKHTNHKIFVSEKQYPKDVFFSENF
jgi:hypothetical protein